MSAGGVGGRAGVLHPLGCPTEWDLGRGIHPMPANAGSSVGGPLECWSTEGSRHVPSLLCGLCCWVVLAGGGVSQWGRRLLSASLSFYHRTFSHGLPCCTEQPGRGEEQNAAIALNALRCYQIAHILPLSLGCEFGQPKWQVQGFAEFVDVFVWHHRAHKALWCHKGVCLRRTISWTKHTDWLKGNTEFPTCWGPFSRARWMMSKFWKTTTD